MLLHIYITEIPDFKTRLWFMLCCTRFLGLSTLSYSYLITPMDSEGSKFWLETGKISHLNGTLLEKRYVGIVPYLRPPSP